MVVDTGPNYLEGVVHICEVEKGFALDVGFSDVEGVEVGRVVVEDTEEVVVVADEVVVRGLVRDLGGGLHGEGAEEAIRWGRRGLCGDSWWTVSLVAAEEG